MSKPPHPRFSAAKRALLAERLRGAQGGSHSRDGILPRPRDLAAPLSRAQERFWFREQLEPQNQAYRRPLLLSLTGPLDRAALGRAVNAVIQRHEPLRAAIITVQGTPILNVQETCEIELAWCDLQRVGESERNEQVSRYALNLLREPLPLDAAPLLKVALLRLAPERHVLVISIHHMLCDGWSVGILATDLAAYYRAFMTGSPAALPKLVVQHSDYAHWQRQQLVDVRFDNQMAYWKQHLEGSPQGTALPVDHPRGPKRSYRGARHVVELPSEITTRIRQTAQAGNVTTFMLMLAAFKVLLHRYHGQTDLVVGSPTAGRTRAELEPLVGFLVNLMVLRTDLSGNPSFASALDRVRTVALGAYANQDLPFERLLEHLRVKRQVNETPLFNVLFELEPPSFGAIEACGLRIEERDFDDGIAHFDLSMEVLETSAGIRVKCVYDRDLFDSVTIERLLDHYQVLLASACLQPDLGIASLPMITDSERRALIADCDRTARPEFGKTCIHALVERQAELHPDQIAVRCEDEVLSYGALERRANRLARHLRSLGVGSGTYAALCLERSTELIVAVLAALKTGAAYVPLDPAYPTERLQHLLDDSGARVLVTRPALLRTLSTEKCELVCLERDRPLIRGQSDAPVDSGVTPSDLVMLLYTSGSTGQPKGVMIEHHSLTNYCEAAAEHYALNRDDRVLQFSSIGFDASAEEIFCTLCAGATLVLRTEQMIGEAREFLTACDRWGISVLALPTAFWHELVRGTQQDDLAWPASIRLCVIGGEQAGASSLAEWFRRVGRRVRLVNTYGPTETTVSSTFCDLDGLERSQFDPLVPIGAPWANTFVYLLDEERQPVPVGVVGELWIGGAGVARGYLNRSDLTEAAFVENPLDEGLGSRFYRSGDLARRRADGMLELVGRRDHQLKIRGFRIEPAEIEHALDGHPDVSRSLVLARNASEADADVAALVAYLIPAGRDIDRAELRKYLRTRLPAHLIPTAFVMLDTFPLTTNGKVDRSALPSPPAIEERVEGDSGAPLTPVQEVLAEIWIELLQIRQVGIHQDFFELGGDSIKATRLAVRVRDRTGVSVSVGNIFEAPTIAEQSEFVEACLISKSE